MIILIVLVRCEEVKERKIKGFERVEDGREEKRCHVAYRSDATLN